MDNVAQGSHSELGLPVPILLLSKTLVSRLTHTSPLFLMSTTPVAFSRVRFILSADSENFFRKLVLSALSVRIVRFTCFLCMHNKCMGLYGNLTQFLNVKQLRWGHRKAFGNRVYYSV